MAHKRLGQHFLTDARVLKKIVESAHLSPHETVLEIGPGEGILTQELLTAAGRVVAVEKDSRLVENLRLRFKEEIGNGKLLLHEGDIRDTSLEQLGLTDQNFVVVANIPYYLTGVLIRELLSGKMQPGRVTLLIQKEVAERIARSTKESLLSLSVKAYGKPRLVMTVPRNAFKPQPSVESAVLVIEDISRNFFDSITPEAFFKTLKAGFGKKRKLLTGNLSGIYPQERVHQAFESLNYEKMVRSEDLSLEKWKKLVETLTQSA